MTDKFLKVLNSQEEIIRSQNEMITDLCELLSQYLSIEETESIQENINRPDE